MKVSQLVLLFVLLFAILSGCSQNDATPATTSGLTLETTAPETAETTVPEPTLPWLEQVAMPWDREGALLEVPITVPDGLHYHSAAEFCGDLLLWSIDAHMEDKMTLEMCLVDLESGEVLGQADIAVSDYISPQVFGDHLYICDDESGNIYRLDKSLSVTKQWKTESNGGTWFMGAQDKVYQFTDSSTFYVTDLSTGASQQLLPGAKDIWASADGTNTVSIDYYSAETGAKTMAILDLNTSEILHDPFDEDFYSVSKSGDIWLCAKYSDGNIFYLANGEERHKVKFGDEHLQLLPDGRLLLSCFDGTDLLLFDLQGKSVAKCCLQESYGMYSPGCVIWSETYQGYFLWVTSEGSSSRLLFWDISVPGNGDALKLEDIPEPSEEETLLKKRADEIGLQYGLTVLVSNDCDTVFDEFTATLATDYDKVSAALTLLENALSVYPEGFLAQLRYDGIHGITIQLISDLQATGGGREGGGYNAFAQNMWDHYLIVIDIDDSTENTYYHEFSHIIDSYLAWDASQREDALFSEEGWNDLNPTWFEGYTFDYSWEQNVKDYSWFIDSYSTISPTEDRARVMEYAMSEYGYWYFYDCPGLIGKLSYYCQCIRDAFDTTGWAETLPWEQYK